MTRELKLALIVGFALVLVVTVLISDHLSHARQAELAGNIPAEPIKAAEPPAITTENDPAPLGDAAPANGLASGAPVTPAPVVAEPSPTPTTLAAADPAPTVLTQGSHAVNPAEPSDHDALFREVARQGGSVHGDTIFVGPPAVKTVQESYATPQPHSPPVVAPVVPIPGAAHAPADTVYTVVAGDSAFKIAKDHYGDGKVWRKLIKYNKMEESGQLKVGTKLNIPSSEVLLGKKAVIATAALPTATPVLAVHNSGTAHPTPAKGHTYTVKKGDTLAEIAKHELGSARRVHEIVELNKKTIKDPDNVPLGAVLTLPA